MQTEASEVRRIWVTGAGGLIGNQVVAGAPAWAPGREAVPLLRAGLDLEDAAAVTARFRRDAPDAVIHCAASSRSTVCQADPIGARRSNVEATRHLAGLAAGIPFVFFSTDLVFDGRKGGYVEDDPVGPLSVYAETKVEAERCVREHPRHLIVRTSLNHGASPSGVRGFDEELAAAWRAGRETTLFDDEFRCPIAAADTARIVWELLLGGARGTFHVAGSERLSRWEIGRRVAKARQELAPRVVAASLRSYVGAPRPADVSLDCGKAERFLGRPMPKFNVARPVAP